MFMYAAFLSGSHIISPRPELRPSYLPPPPQIAGIGHSSAGMLCRCNGMLRACYQNASVGETNEARAAHPPGERRSAFRARRMGARVWPPGRQVDGGRPPVPYDEWGPGG